MDTLPTVPGWLVLLCVLLVTFAVDILKQLWANMPGWVKMALSLGVGQVLVWWATLDIFAAAKLMPGVTPLGIILSGLLLSAGASIAAQPLKKAVLGIAEPLGPGL